MSITIIIIILTVIVSLQGFNNPAFIEQTKHWPYREAKAGEYWRLISSGFVHANWIHLGINMFVLWQFGEYVELLYQTIFGSLFGGILYVVMYLSCIAFADLPTFFKHRENYHYGGIGASGAVSGIVFIFVLVNPWNMLYIWGILPIPAIVGGIAYLWYSNYASRNSQSNIDHDAHFYGAIYGVLFTLIAQPSLFNVFLQQIADLPF